MDKRKRWHLAFAAMLFFMTFTSSVQAKNTSPLTIQNTSATYEFGQQITFHATLDDGNEMQNANLFVHPEGQNTSIHNLDHQNNEVEYRYNVQQNPIRPFAQVEYWFSFTESNGEVIKSKKCSFNYEDNRFAWQQLSEGNLTIHWTGDNESKGKQILTISRQAIKSAQTYLPVELTRQVNIYLYPTQSDLQSAVQLGQLSWIAGHASPDLGIILISAAQESDLTSELERQIPHEMMHILQYQVADTSYEDLPEWLVEGMASLAETNRNKEYGLAFENALADHNLPSISSLCTTFPQDKNEAFLAYAQSESFVRYLYDLNGAEGLHRLVEQYHNDVSCSHGVKTVYSVSLAQLEIRWLEKNQSESRYANAINNLVPYLILLLIVTIIPFIPWVCTNQKTQKK